MAARPFKAPRASPPRTPRERRNRSQFELIILGIDQEEVVGFAKGRSVPGESKADAMRRRLSDKSYEARFDRAKRLDAVELTRFPSMVEHYGTMVRQLSRPPTQSEFVEGFIRRYIENPTWSELFTLPLEAIRYRLQKAWPSFIREHHVREMLRDAFRIYFSTEVDQQVGVDAVIVDGDHAYRLRVFTRVTKRAEDWQRVKAHRHPLEGRLIIDVVLHEGQRDQLANGLWLYPRSTVDQVRQKMLELRSHGCSWCNQSRP